MHFLLVAVEGNTEKSLIEAFKEVMIGQEPGPYGKIEIVPIVLGGNQGHVAIVEAANKEIKKYINNPDNCYEEKSDEVEKWLVFDYDNMDTRGISLSDLRSKAESEGFKCVVSKPNIEFFILALLSNYEYAISIKPKDYNKEINRLIDKINLRDETEDEWFTRTTRIVSYNKNAHQCKAFFSSVFSRHHDLLKKVMEENNCEGDRYTELPILLRRILNITVNRSDDLSS